MKQPKSLKHLPEHTSTHCTIYETPNFQDGVKLIIAALKAGRKCLGLFDLDNTVLSFRHTLGTDQWFEFNLNQFMKDGYDHESARKMTLNQQFDLARKIHIEDVYAVENSTPQAITALQAQGIDCLALSARKPLFLDTTLEQLARFQINFNQGRYQDKEKDLSIERTAMLTQGLILTDGQHKGDCLIKCLDPLHLPDVIVMWEDKLHNLLNVKASIEKFNQEHSKNIEFIGIRYSRLDEKALNVNPKVVELQKAYFDRILSDKHARAILKQQAKKGRPPYVDISVQNEQVILSICKPKLLPLLRDLDKNFDAHRLPQATLEPTKFYEKDKLAWQYQYSLKAFPALFSKLSQHGLVLPAQFDQLSPIFNPHPKAVTHQYNLRARTKPPAPPTKQARLAF